MFLSRVSAIIGTSVATLLITIEDMNVLSKKMFFNSLSLHASRLMDKVRDSWMFQQTGYKGISTLITSTSQHSVLLLCKLIQTKSNSTNFKLLGGDSCLMI